MRLTDCIPKTKYDIVAVENATALGFPTINAILPELLEWVQDGNWPVARGILDLLAQSGPEIVPHIQTIFDGTDEEWKYFILSGLITDLSPEVAALLRANVVRMSRTPTAKEKASEVNEVASDVLRRWSGAIE